MKRLTWWMLPLAAALVLGLVTANLAVAADEGGKAKKEKGEKAGGGEIRGEYAILASECGLTDAQKELLAAKLKASKEATDKWEQENGQKAKDLQAKMKAAKEAGNAEEAKGIAQELKTLLAERARLTEGNMTAVYDMLTPEQKVKWNGFKLYRVAMMRYKKLELTEDQTAKVRALADETAKGVDPTDEKAAKKAMTTLAEKIEQDVLTPEQRENLSKKGEKPEKPEGDKKSKKTEEAGAEG